MAAVEMTVETSQISGIDSVTNSREEPVAILPDAEENQVTQTETGRDCEEVVSKVDSGNEKESKENKKETTVKSLKGILKHEHIYGLDKKTVAFESEVEMIPYKKEFAIDIQIVKELTKRVVSYRELFKQKLEEEKSAKDKAAEDDDDDEPIDNMAFSHLLLREPPIHHSTSDTDVASLNPSSATKQNEKNANLPNTSPQDPSSKENEIEDQVSNKIVEKSKFNVTLVEEFLESNPSNRSDVPINQSNVESIDNVIDVHVTSAGHSIDNNTLESKENDFEINININDKENTEMSSETSILIVNSKSLINNNEKQGTSELPFLAMNKDGAVTNNSIDTPSRPIVQQNTESVEEFFDCAPECSYKFENQFDGNELSDVSKTMDIVSPELEEKTFESFDDQALSSELNYLKQLEIELAVLENTIDKLSNMEKGMTESNFSYQNPSCSRINNSNLATEVINCDSKSNYNPIQLENATQPTEILEKLNCSNDPVSNLTNNNLGNEKVISSSIDELSNEFRPRSSVDIKFISDELAPDRHLKVTLKCIKEERSSNTQDNTDASDKLQQRLNEHETQIQTVEETDTDTSSDLISASDESSVSVVTPLSGLVKCQNVLDFDLSLKHNSDLDQSGMSSARTGYCVCAPSSSGLNETVTQDAGVQTDFNHPSHCLQCTCSRVAEGDTPNNNTRSESQLSASVSSTENDNLATVWELDCQEDKSLTDSTEGNFRDFTQSTNLDCSTSLSMESIELDDTSLRIEMVNGCSSLSEDISV